MTGRPSRRAELLLGLLLLPQAITWRGLQLWVDVTRADRVNQLVSAGADWVLRKTVARVSEEFASAVDVDVDEVISA